MTERRFLGVVEVDSGTLIVGDPLYLLPCAEDARPGIDYEAVLQARDSVISPLNGQPVVLLQEFGGDGTFPLIGEYEDGELVRVIVEFIEPGEE